MGNKNPRVGTWAMIIPISYDPAVVVLMISSYDCSISVVW